MLAGLTVSAGCDTTNDIDPSIDTPADLIEENGVNIWATDWDNPILFGRAGIREPQQYVFRQGDASTYKKFDLTVSVATGEGMDELNTWAASEGTFGGGLGDEQYFWEAHGTRLIPNDMALAQAFRDDWDRPRLAYRGPGTFRLAASASLVPLNVIVMYPNDGSVSPDWMPESYVDLIVDDGWTADKTINTDPGSSPDQVDIFWTRRFKPGTELLHPDRIWDQCAEYPGLGSIQFRKFAFSTCPVDPLVFRPPAGDVTKCNTLAQENSVLNALADCPGATTPGTKIIFVDSLTPADAGCIDGVTLGVTRNQTIVIMTFFGAISDFTIAHELGHVLGLGHESVPCATLMCESHNAIVNFLDSTQCGTAKLRAETLQQVIWP